MAARYDDANSHEVAPEAVAAVLGITLLEGEAINRAFEIGRDVVMLTDKRILLRNRVFTHRAGVELLSVPIRSVYRFSIEVHDGDPCTGLLRIWAAGGSVPQSKHFNRRTKRVLGLPSLRAVDLYDVEQAISAAVL